VITCPSCGRESPDAFTFCPACGTALATSSHGGTRATVTILFCDLVDSTSMGERLDPEALRAVMDRYFDEMRSAVERHGGVVEKYIGDAVMAVFGVPVVHEDDALRAVRAASEMRFSLARLDGELERDYGVRVGCRIGVHTGEVVTGDAAAGERMVTGDAVNTAARLEQAARPGEILVGAPTYRLVRDAADVEAPRSIVAKGKDAELDTYPLLEVDGSAAPRARRLRSPLVGRERELALLRQALDRVVADRECQLFTVLGPAGIGKSRLMEEFLASIPPETLVFRGRCLPYGEGITFFPVVEVVKQAAGLADFDELDAIERKIAAVLAREEAPDAIGGPVAQLLGAGSGASLEETRWAIRRFLEAVAREHATIVVFDDIQWGEPAFLDVVDHVTDLARVSALLLVCMARPELLDERSGWGGGKRNSTSILLEPLPESDSGLLVENLLGAADVAPGIRERIVTAAGGTPLFVEEMLAMLIDEGYVEPSGGGWVVSRDLDQVPIPATISALLSARLARLDAAERDVLARASVVGEEFFLGAVRALTSDGTPEGVSGAVTALVRKDLVRPRPSRLPGEEAYAFRHLLIRDAAYDAIPKATRAELHERLADWLEEIAGDRLAEQEEIVGYHVARAHDLLVEVGPEDDRARALSGRAGERYAKAGRRAFARGDVAAAIDLLERSADLLPGDHPRLTRVLVDLADARFTTGETAAVREIVQRAIDTARRTGSSVDQADAHLADTSIRALMSPDDITPDERRDVATRAVDVFGRAGDAEGLSAAYMALSDVAWTIGDAGEQVATAERAIETSRGSFASITGEGAIETSRGSFASIGTGAVTHLCEGLWRGPVPCADALIRTERVIAESGGHRAAWSTAEGYAGLFLAMLGRFDDGRRRLDEALAVFEEMDSRWSLTGTVALQGMVSWVAGEHEVAERDIRVEFDYHAEAGDMANTVMLGCDLARPLLDLGRNDEVLELTDEIAANTPVYDVQTQCEWRARRGVALSRRGQADEAVALVEEAERIARTTDFLSMLADTMYAKAEVLREAGRRPEAASAARATVELFERKGFVPLAARSRELLVALGG
jgi:class 3 adenylate cyclase/tetratricopeptide (TPR) repeat protein